MLTLYILLLNAILIFLLVIILKRQKPDGQIVIIKDEYDKLTYLLEIDVNPADIRKMKFVLFKVVGEQSIAD
jgi:hypothetical protein